MSFYIVPTPIGNLNDFSQRGLEILNNSDIILCEKKTRALKLLNFFNIRPKLLIAYHDDKCEKIAPRIIKDLKNKKNISLISDAGTPLISDPGHKLVKTLIDNDIEPISIPGPTSIISALTLSTMDISNFLFLGFLPKNKKKIHEILTDKLAINVPVVILSSSRELVVLIDILSNSFQNTFISVSKEISKINEGTKRGTSTEIKNIINNDFFKKGEFVITILNFNQKDSVDDKSEISSLLISLKNEGLTLKKSVDILKKQKKISKKIIYQIALKIWNP